MNQSLSSKSEMDQLFSVVCDSNKYHEKSLTVGFSYGVYGEDDNKYLVKNDKEEIKLYYKSRFKKS